MNTNITSNSPCDPIQAGLIDVSNYYDQEKWFRLLQEDGIRYSKLEACYWEKTQRRKRVATLLSSECTTNNCLHSLK